MGGGIGEVGVRVGRGDGEGNSRWGMVKDRGGGGSLNLRSYFEKNWMCSLKIFTYSKTEWCEGASS